MKYKFLCILLASIFLISAVSVISADDFDGYSDDYSGDSIDDSGYGGGNDYTDDTTTQDSNTDSTSEVKNEKITLTIKGSWDDNKYVNRPSSFVVHIKNGDQVVKTVTLKKEDNWEITADVDKYDSNGKEIKYSLDVEKISGYKTPVVTKTGNTFKIFNDIVDVKKLGSNKGTNDISDSKSVKELQNKINPHKSNVAPATQSNSDKNTSKDLKNNSTKKNITNNTNKTNNANKTKTNKTNVTANNTTAPTIIYINNNSNADASNFLKNAGNPILILVIVIIIIGVVVYVRKRN
ncbi:MAG: Cna B-type domain-containing protein [Methanobrevibacter sp.]|nr:Cna B-type domain-containing protein [Methanobrevibacter sp.]